MRLSIFLSGMLMSLVCEARLLDQASDYLLQQAQRAHPEATVSVRMQPLDPQFNIPNCAAPQLSIQSQTLIGRVAVSARCLTPKIWTLFVTGNVTVEKPIVVTTGMVGRGSILTQQDLALKLTDIGRIRSGYLTDIDMALGTQAKRLLHAGEVVYDRFLAPAIVVKKGDKVSIRARTGAVSVSAAGTALQDGVQGQQIRVRNKASQRIVRAWVIQRGLVSTSS